MEFKFTTPIVKRSERMRYSTQFDESERNAKGDEWREMERDDRITEITYLK